MPTVVSVALPQMTPAPRHQAAAADVESQSQTEAEPVQEATATFHPAQPSRPAAVESRPATSPTRHTSTRSLEIDGRSPWALPRAAGGDVQAPAEQLERAVLALRRIFGLQPRDTEEMSLERTQAEEFGISYGVPTGDADIVKAVWRVVALSSISCAFYIATFIARLLMGLYTNPGDPNSPDELWSGCSQLVIELSIPACGYYGALYTHRTLVFFFCGANLIFVIASVINFLRFIIRIGATVDMCQQGQEEQWNACEAVHSEGPAKYIFILSLVFMMCFGCLSFGAGKGLYQGLGPVDPLQMPLTSLPVVGEVIARTEGNPERTAGEGTPAEESTSTPQPDGNIMSIPDEERRAAALAAQRSAAAAATRRSRS